MKKTNSKLNCDIEASASAPFLVSCSFARKCSVNHFVPGYGLLEGLEFWCEITFKCLAVYTRTRKDTTDLANWAINLTQVFRPGAAACLIPDHVGFRFFIIDVSTLQSRIGLWLGFWKGFGLVGRKKRVYFSAISGAEFWFAKIIYMFSEICPSRDLFNYKQATPDAPRAFVLPMSQQKFMFGSAWASRRYSTS